MKTILYTILGWILRGFVRSVGHIVYRFRTHGTENIPSSGGALLVANHASYMDFVIVVTSVPRPVRFVMNADVFRKRSLKWLLKGLGCIPISPRGGNNNFDDFNLAVKDQVDDGHIVVIFAEGTVTRTGQLLEFKKGVEHLSGMINGPVIPIHLHNVHGSPFSFRAGKNKVEKLSLKNLRKEVLVNIGQPIYGGVKAFSLRQNMKEMEVENFNFHLGTLKTLDGIIADQLPRTNNGSWTTNDSTLRFNDITQKLQELDVVLRPLLMQDDRVALLLPKGHDAFLLNLWLIINNKIVVNINPDFTNEERFYVLNKAGISTLVTTLDLEFSRYSPNAERIIYMEQVYDELETGKKVSVISRRFNRVSRSIRSLFKPSTKQDQVVTIFFEKQKNDELKCVALTHRNILAVLHGLRQIYYFDRGSRMMSNLPFHHSYGFIVEFLLPLFFDMKVELVEDGVNAEDFIHRMMDAQPSLVIATPKQLGSIAELSQLKNIPFLTHVFTADLRPDHHNIELLGQRGIKVMVCAGMNETSSVFAANLHNYRGKDIAGKIMEQENMQERTIGKPLPGIALKVCDKNLVELPHDEFGEIWIKGACIAPALESDIRCSPTLVNDWFNTGLKGSLNHRGFVSIQQ